ncbi:vacuolar protein sorting/targeting protein PEP1 [Aspergillus wentii]|nr:vacuolar protein sorting/targeting protein PEP1 [Aspergillus wentii]
MIFRWLPLVSCLLLALLSQPGAAKKSDGPKITTTKLDHAPSGLFYFEGTDTIIFNSQGDLHRSFDGGETWEVVQGTNGNMKGQVFSIWPHTFDNNKAYALGFGRHWITKDKAKTWESFEIDDDLIGFDSPSLSFHGWDSNKVIFQSEICVASSCIASSYYTTDDFSTVKLLRRSIYGCSWAVGHPQFAEDLDVSSEIENRIYCIVPGLKSKARHANRLVYSDDFFSSNPEGTEVNLQQGRPASGVLSTAAVKKYLVAAAQSQGTDEHALYVTDDAKTWHRAEFGSHRLEENAYTVLESTNYSIQVDVLTSKSLNNHMGALFTSNSNGTYFTSNIKHTNRNRLGYVDFEKVADIQGIVLVNTVKNWEEVIKSDSPDRKKQVISEISFDDGRTFQPIKVGDKKLHLHSVTTFNGATGRVFSTPAPGIVMGIGNTGDHLKSLSDGSLYVSDDAGLTWKHAQDGPHKYEFGDQGAVVMAVAYSEKTDKIKFSVDHGKDWESVDLEHEIYPAVLTTTPDSTSLRFLLIGYFNKNGEGEHVIYSIDFGGLHERKCEESDFEKWPARLDENREPDCLMGHKQFFHRRKADADCFVEEEFKIPQPIFEPCKCTEEDFECDYNFKRSEDRKSCEPAAPLTPKAGQCKDPNDKYMGPSGWRLIPGNNCIRDGGKDLDKEIERSCGDVGSTPHTPTDGKIIVKKHFFDEKGFSEYFYLERQSSSSGTDETIVMRTREGFLYISHDHGKSWEKLLKGKKVSELIPHPYYSDGAFFLTDGKEGFCTANRGYTVDSFKAPNIPRPKQLSPLSFHQQYKDTLIWTGATECNSEDCHFEAHYSTNRGANWELLLREVRKCNFMGRDDRNDSENLVFCEQFENENKNNPLQLLSSKDWFSGSSFNFNFTGVEDFATMAEYIVVASHDENNPKSLKASTSVDGKTFADAKFPVNLDVPVQNAYTVLESSSHAIFLHVTVNKMVGALYGSLIKSNSNGTSYVLSINAVNRNDLGYADFEKMQGLEGVMVVNVVGNLDAVNNKGASKKLKTMITHNDGAQWALLPPPTEGHNFGCSVTTGRGTDQCSLHLHGYTERRDPRDTFSSASAIGLMMGTGNVGEYLASKEEADTFITRDGGITWKSVKKGKYIWEYGDAGSIIVIVLESKPTKVLHYSINEGDTWEDFQFSDVEMQIDDISTLPSDTSKNFLLWGKDLEQGKFTTVNVDFSGTRTRSCRVKDGDFYLWEPKHPLQENNCLFGHIEQYHRKKPEAECWTDWREPRVHSIGENCTCTRNDYECDYNYEPQSDGSCALVPGLPKPDAMATCKANPDEIEYWEPTGYRRIPLTTCQGGLNLDHVVSKACPSKEKEYQEKHGISGVGLFFAIVIPIALAGAAGYYAYTRWDGKFGQIRLGEGGNATSERMLSRDSPLIIVPVAVIAGVVAVAKALPLLATSLWRSASGYMRVGRNRDYQGPYASRGSFAARRGDYTSVVDDEDELLGVIDAEGDDDEM